MNIERAQATTGWMSDAELTYLAECAGKSTAIVEIGSWKGRSTLALLATPPARSTPSIHGRGRSSKAMN